MFGGLAKTVVFIARIFFHHDVCLFVFVRCFTHFFYVFKTIILLQRGFFKNTILLTLARKHLFGRMFFPKHLILECFKLLVAASFSL